VRVLEFYCGIGGFAHAMPPEWQVLAAVDQNVMALETYGEFFSHPRFSWNIVGLTAERLGKFEADFWWLSPPCRPFTIRGARGDVADPRCESFLHLVELLETLRPEALGFENVPGFVGSEAQRRFLSTLTRAGYQYWQGVLCPTSWGIPNRRRRYYLIASRTGLNEFKQPQSAMQSLASFVKDGTHDELIVPPSVLSDYEGAIDIVDPHRVGEVTNCFTSAYGRSWVRSGSYLDWGDSVRRFTPEEVLGLLGFPSDMGFPDSFERRSRWALAGNSLSVVVVRSILSILQRG
jgi:site-specific DNA-cytosine methylase